MEQFPGAQFLWEVYPVSAQNKSLISDTDARSKYICDPFWHSESDVARAEYLVSPIMP